MKRFPEVSKATPVGLFNSAEVAGPPSPEKPPVYKPEIPLPATVVTIPLVDTFRIRLPPASATKRFPEASTATPSGIINAEVAGPPSPAPVGATPLPANVTMTLCPLAATHAISTARPSRPGLLEANLLSTMRQTILDGLVEVWPLDTEP